MSKIRLALWDYISREVCLPAPPKMILLVIANYTESRSRRANIPMSLLVRDSGLEELTIRQMMLNLEASQRLEKLEVPTAIGRPPQFLYNLSAGLIQAALRQQVGKPNV
ncbi:hypothetical protein [Leptolyngbya sp. FACHB-261]|uniref:hypothetical protein n=1 Tax=Leptolyngbya sp. FACHB-261 TaxID=2692806 RepID=UPI0016875473|nr:hypothetical protein [Leptolyngbya sp. FACHB-261]MBD2100203.1 hypothetical protein [Leptolyngbya sp. FACHB-261]